MINSTHGRLTVALGGGWRLYTTTLPAGSRAIGTVTRDGHDTGALVLMASGSYAQCNAGSIRILDQRAVAAAVTAARSGSHGGPGRGQGIKAADGAINLKRVNVSLDDASIDALRHLGDGRLSLGIRRAAAHIKSALPARDGQSQIAPAPRGISGQDTRSHG